MKKYIVTEYCDKDNLIEWIFADRKSKDFKIINACGYSGALSSIRSIQIRGGSQVVYLCNLAGMSPEEKTDHLSEIDTWINSTPTDSTFKLVELDQPIQNLIFSEKRLVEAVIAESVPNETYLAFCSSSNPSENTNQVSELLEKIKRSPISARPEAVSRYIKNTPLVLSLSSV